MANVTASNELSNYSNLPVVKPSAVQGYGARVRRYRATVTNNTQVATSNTLLAVVPAGSVFAFGFFNSDTNMGACLLGIGNTSSPVKYMANTSFLGVTNQPVLLNATFAVESMANLPQNTLVAAADEEVRVVYNAANAPAAGNFVIDLYFTTP